MHHTPAFAKECRPPAWWSEARFGLFIHWGVYAVPAGVHRGQQTRGASEWLMHAAQIPVAEYKRYAKGLTAANYDADAWVRAALDAGMGYMVITAKHHDGFALFDTAVNDWSAVRASPAGRDLLRPLVEACRRAGMPLGFYYSHAQDWANGGAAFGGHWDPAQARDFNDYLDRVAIPQIRELLTLYGPGTPSMLWWDTPAEMTPERTARVAAAVEELRPGILQNDRLALDHSGGHFVTPEQRIPAKRPNRPWETCMTTNESWGFNLHDEAWKPPEMLIRQLCEVVSQGGNYLLNIGPQADGTIPEPSLQALANIGRWMRKNSGTITGADAGPFPHRLPWGVATRKGRAVHLLVDTWPSDRVLHVPLLNLPERVEVPGSDAASAVRVEGAIEIQLPPGPSDPAVSVVTLHFAEEPRLGTMPAQPRPPVVPQMADGTVTLGAADAEITGDHLGLMGGTDPRLGTWTALDSWPSWRTHLEWGRRYRVDLVYAVPRHREGTLAHVEIGSQSLPMIVAGTGGWEEFVRTTVGEINLAPADELPVRVVPVTIPVGAVMNLRAVILTPTARTGDA